MEISANILKLDALNYLGFAAKSPSHVYLYL